MIRRPPRSTLFPYTRSSDLEPLEHHRLARQRERDRQLIEERRLELAPQHHRETERGEPRSEEHTSELQSRRDLVCRLLLEKKKNNTSPDTMRFYHNLPFDIF